MTYATYDTLPANIVRYKEGDDTKQPGVLLWSDDHEIPAIGADIVITMNGIGPATVVGYFSEHGWFGVLTKAHNPPEWLAKRHGPNYIGHCFGVEFKPA